MEKTLINIKTDKKLKAEAQKVAKELGLPLGTIINSYLRDLIREKRVVFSTVPEPNKHTEKILKEIAKDIKSGQNVKGPYTYEEAVKYLDSL